MASFFVASRLAALLAFAQSASIAAPNANIGSPAFTFPGMLSSASARQMHLHPLDGFSGSGMDVSALLSLSVSCRSRNWFDT
jgi:hypothetical protein